MSDEHVEPGPLAPEKISEDSAPGRPEPDAEEVESARLLANGARPTLEADGFDDEEIRRLADAYVALDLGEETDDFIAWARERRG
jgi:hypothetical protein